jgi:hypothetical protein
MLLATWDSDGDVGKSANAGPRYPGGHGHQKRTQRVPTSPWGRLQSPGVGECCCSYGSGGVLFRRQGRWFLMAGLASVFRLGRATSRRKPRALTSRLPKAAFRF